MDVLHEQDQMKLVSWGSFKLRNEIQVKIACGWCLGVDQKTSATDLASENGGALDDVDQESCADTASLVLVAYSEACE